MKRNELLRRIQSNDAPLVVDARSPIEFKRGHIPGAVNAPVSKILFGMAHLPADKNREMVIACMHGQRAWTARKLLGMQGYRNTDLLDGYLQEWIHDGLPWEKESS
jgi:rhodanese-related sulfurtransferase